MECIYILQAEGTDLLKIGRTTVQRLDQRHRDIDASSPIPITLVTYFEVRVGDGRRFEHHVHGLLRDKRVRGEWFRVTIEEARATIERAYENRVEKPLDPFDDHFPKSMNQKYFRSVFAGK